MLEFLLLLQIQVSLIYSDISKYWSVLDTAPAETSTQAKEAFNFNKSSPSNQK